MRRIQALGFVAGLILFTVAFYSGTLADPYQGHNYNVTKFDSSLESHNYIQQYQYKELSPEAQKLFDRINRAEKSYNADVCLQFTLICNGYRLQDLPSDFDYDSSTQNIIVEKNQTKYTLSSEIVGYKPASDTIIDFEKIGLYILRLLILISGLLMIGISINPNNNLDVPSKEMIYAILATVIIIITCILFYNIYGNSLEQFINSSAQYMIGNIIFMLFLSILLSVVGILPVYYGFNIDKDYSTIKYGIIGSFLIIIYVTISPYFEMYGLFNIGISRLIFLLLFMFYKLLLFNYTSILKFR